MHKAIFAFLPLLLLVPTSALHAKKGRLFAPPSTEQPASTEQKHRASEQTRTENPTHSGLEDTEEEFAPANNDFLGQKNTKKRSPDLEDDDLAPSSLGVSGGVLIGAGQFGAMVMVSYMPRTWFGYDFYFNYLRATKDGNNGWTHVHYGPGVDLKLLLPNPTIVTPFVGAGPSFVLWQNEWNNPSLEPDDSSSAMLHYFGGASIKLTKFLNLVLEHRTSQYLGKPPRDREKPTDYDPKSFSQFSARFAVILNFEV